MAGGRLSDRHLDLAALQLASRRAAGELPDDAEPDRVRQCVQHGQSVDRAEVGSLEGAAGAVEAIYSVLAIRDNVAPPTLNLDNPSVETAIDLVPHTARPRDINAVLSNSFGFGGTNASLVFHRV